MNTFAEQFILALPTLLAISAIVTWLVSAVKPYVTTLGMSDNVYALTIRLIAAVFGVVLAGLLGNPNIFAGIIFYGAEIPPIVGMLATAILTSAGSNALHEIGEYLSMRPTTIAASDSAVTVDNRSGGDSSTTVSASSTGTWVDGVPAPTIPTHPTAIPVPPVETEAERIARERQVAG